MIGLTNKAVRWGVLSTARIGVDWVIPAINKTSNGKVVALASRNEDKARKVTHSLGIPKPFGDYLKLLESKDIDAVYISLPNSMHRKWTILAAENGKHVLCEKPLALNLREAEEMAEACRKADVRLFEAFMYRFFPHMAKLKEQIESGSIGKVSVIKSDFNFKLDDPNDIRLNKELGGGALYDLGCYCVNFSRLMTGREPVKVQGTAHHRNEVDDVFAGTMQFPNGEIAIFDCGFQTILRHSVEVVGEKGTLTISAAFEPGSFEREIIRRRQGEKAERIPCQNVNPYSLMAEHFADCILNDREQQYPVSDSFNNMRTIDKLYDSIRVT